MSTVKQLIQKAFKDGSFYFLSQVLVRFSSLLIIPIITRMLSIEDFATYDMFLMLTSSGAVLGHLGMDSGASIIIAENLKKKPLLSAIVTLRMGSNLLVIIVLSLFVYVLHLFGLNVFFTDRIFLLLLINVLVTVVMNVTFNFFMWSGQSKTAAIVNLISSLGGILLGFALLNSADQKIIEHFLLGLVIGKSFGALFCLFLLKNYFFEATLSNIRIISKDIFRLSLPYIPVDICNNLMRLVDRILIVNLLGQEALGQYAFAFRIANASNFLINATSKGVRPIMLQNHTTEEGKKFSRLVYERYLILIPVIYLITILISPHLTEIFGGDKYMAAAPIIGIMVLSTFFFSSIAFSGFGYLVKRKTHIFTVHYLISILINLGLSLLFINLGFGLMGIALGVMISSAIFAVLYTVYSEKLYPMGYNMKRVFIIFLITGIITLMDVYYYI